MEPRRRRLCQSSLFDPPMTTPQWESLPEEIRKVTLSLLVQLLREHPLPPNVVHDTREVTDE